MAFTPTANNPEPTRPPDDTYVWSNTRVREQVTVNVLTAAAIAVLSGIIALLGLLAQRIFNYIVVPTNVLAVVAFFGLGTVIAFVLVILASYIAIKRNPWLGIGVIVGMAIGKRTRRKATKDTKDTHETFAQVSARLRATQGQADQLPRDSDKQ